MISRVQPGEQMSADLLNQLIDAVNSRTFSGGGGFSGATAQATPGEQIQPVTTSAYVYEIDEDLRRVRVKHARYKDATWGVPAGDGNFFWAKIGAGYEPADFELFILEGDEPELTDPSILLIEDEWAVPTSITSSGFWGGKILEVNLHSQMALVAPIKEGLNPVGADWQTGDAHFDLEAAKCVWIMGYTGYQKDQPVVVFELKGQPFPWAINAWNLTGADFERWCTPTGPFTPQTLDPCEPPPNTPICQTGACCFENQCVLLQESACDAVMGTWYLDEDCDTVDPTLCPQLNACCLPDGTCVERSVSICIAIGGTPQDANSCSGADCETLGPCCFLDGTCLDLLPSVCAGTGGQPITNCDDCQDLIGCCVGMNKDFEVVFCTQTQQSICMANCPTDLWCDWCSESPCGIDPCGLGLGSCP